MPNFDEKTGIRYGVISPHDISSWSLDEIYQSGTDPIYEEYIENTEQEYRDDHPGDKFNQEDFDSYMENCKMEYESDGSGIMDYSDSEYDLHVSGDNFGIFVMRSPYYTYCRGCSPCAPGAGDLNSPIDVDGGVPRTELSPVHMAFKSGSTEKTLCLGHEWFDQENDQYSRKIPYRVFRISDDSEVLPGDES
jgi:hypothetical protein